MKKSSEKQIEDKLNRTRVRLTENELLLTEATREKGKIYESVKDFNVGYEATDNAIKKMRAKDSEINGIRRRIKNDLRKIENLSK